ncbi:hypothetical protein M3Y94_01240000 [Aphelenchoides besseyi]|nr:hypothetical protein M3Y94_01240000 [Aphelenchoides besseyi]KAI6217205.1 Zinc finger, C3HC4 type [Aphelenchoides besseyi]
MAESKEVFKKRGVLLSLRKVEPKRSSTNIADVFGEESDEDETAQTSKTQRFDTKYGGLKAREQRAVERVLEDDPNAYAYDEVYDSMAKNKKGAGETEKKKDVDRSAKYIDRFMEAKKKRDLEQLLRDERKQEKERVAEGDEFKGKDVFITSAYRKQLEETVKFRKELEASDEIDERTKVQNQKMWRENFNKRLLEDRVQDRFAVAKITEDPEVKKEPSVEKEPSVVKDPVAEEKQVVDKKPDVQKKPSVEKESTREKGPLIEKVVKPQVSRMEKVRAILKQRNTEADIEAARERYLERRRSGLIAPIN